MKNENGEDRVMNKMPKISEAEWKIMKIIWDTPKITSTNIIEALKDKEEWKFTTIKSLINRLLNKKAIGFNKLGKEYFYYPLLSEDECIRLQSQSFINRVFNGSINSMLLTFVKLKEISEKDLDELKDILEKSKEKEGL